MTANEAISYIEHYSWSTTKLGLSRTKELLRRLGDPQKELKIVHVAGSNGKGSFCAMLEAVLRAAGYKTGFYISPYIQEFSERIQISGVPIPGEDLARITEKVRSEAESMEDHPSQFELVTAVGLEYFREQGCDIVVLEVGMGGLLDSTNAIDSPLLAVIMNIGLEHTEYLGSTLSEIASAKAGIIKTGCECVCYGDLPKEALSVIEKRCRETEVPLHIAPKETSYLLSLYGPHQRKNAAAVVEAVNVLRKQGWDVPEEALTYGLSHTYWPARFEFLSENPPLVLDGGHNPQCAEALKASVQERFSGQKAVFLLGVLADKDYAEILDIVYPIAERFVCLTPLSERALPSRELASFINRRYGEGRATACDTIPEGIKASLECARSIDRSLGGKKPPTPVVAFGSLYLAGAIRNEFEET